MTETAGNGAVADTVTEGAVDAIDDALGLTTEPEGNDTEVIEGGDEPGDELGGEQEGEGEEPGEGEPKEGEEGAPESEFNEDGTRKERNPDGTFKKPEAAKKADPVNDPIPKDLKKETAERMQSLIKIAKEVTAERDQERASLNTIVNGIQASGTSPEQYGEVISWMQLFNSPSREGKMKAYELVKDVAERLATMLGVEHTASDPLANHPDLKAAIASGKATVEMAREVARTREAAKFNGDIQRTQQTQQQTQQQAQAEHNQAKADLNAFDVEMRGKDPLYDLKRAQIVPTLQKMFKRIPKSQWAAAYKEAYADAKVQPKGPAAKVVPKGQPLRGGKQPAGGQGRPAASALEAMSAAISGMAK